jgi:hypothetical protein
MPMLFTVLTLEMNILEPLFVKLLYCTVMRPALLKRTPALVFCLQYYITFEVTPRRYKNV